MELQHFFFWHWDSLMGELKSGGLLQAIVNDMSRQEKLRQVGYSAAHFFSPTMQFQTRIYARRTALIWQ